MTSEQSKVNSLTRLTPKDFLPKLSVVGCCLVYQNKILLLKRAKGCSQENTWTLPSGKVEQKETLHEAMLREVKEETGVTLPKEHLHYLGKEWMRLPHIDYNFHLFFIELKEKPKITLAPKEHEDYKWVSLQEARELNLIHGGEYALNLYEEATSGNAYTAHINVNLILKKEDTILLSKRLNTGYFDGHWGAVSGHVERGESPTEAAVREAFEEAGIVISPNALHLVHTMHRIHDRPNLDLFFIAENWERELINREPHKCSALEFFSKNNLPPETIPYVAEAIQNIESNTHYSEP